MDANNPQAVLISGGGIAGLTLACALRQRGIACDVVEAKPTLSDDGGVGLTLVGNALRALQQIGLAAPILAAGVPASHIRLCAPDGRLLTASPTAGPWGEGLPGHCGISRRTLHAALVDAARSRGAGLITGTRIVDTRREADGMQARFADGRSARYALCVAAEGLFSQARERLFPGVQPTHAGQASWRARVPRPTGLDTTEIYLGGRFGVVGICPIAPDEAYLYIVESAQEGVREDDARLHLGMRERLAGAYGGHVAPLLAHLTDTQQVSYRPLPVLLVPTPWHRDRTLLIGDAAHANPPVLAQGAAMGIEDAVVLAEELAPALTAAGGDVDAALDRFMQRRFERVRLVVESSAQLARWEVEHRKDVDVGAVMARVGRALAEPV